MGAIPLVVSVGACGAAVAVSAGIVVLSQQHVAILALMALAVATLLKARADLEF
jgi:F0F1-type ATP synthase epsilon subunit